MLEDVSSDNFCSSYSYLLSTTLHLQAVTVDDVTGRYTYMYSCLFPRT